MYAYTFHGVVRTTRERFRLVSETNRRTFLTGDVETTTGLLQQAIVSPVISVVRLAIAVGILLTLNWRLALTAGGRSSRPLVMRPER